MNHVGRWRDVADLVAQHLDTPRVRRLVDLAHDGVIERIALREGLAQVELADLRTHGRLRQIDGGPPVVLDAVAGTLRIDHPEIDETVHGDLHVVAGDAGLARHVDHLLAHLMAVGDAIEEWDQDVEPRLQDLAELTETLDHKGARMGTMHAVFHRSTSAMRNKTVKKVSMRIAPRSPTRPVPTTSQTERRHHRSADRRPASPPSACRRDRRWSPCPPAPGSGRSKRLATNSRERRCALLRPAGSFR